MREVTIPDPEKRSVWRPLAALSRMTSIGTLLCALVVLVVGPFWSRDAALLTGHLEDLKTDFVSFNLAAETKIAALRARLFAREPRHEGSKPDLSFVVGVDQQPSEPNSSVLQPSAANGWLPKYYPEALWFPMASPKRWSPKEIADGLRICLKALASIEADVEPLPPIREGACGIAAPVKLRSLGGEEKVTFKPPLTINCPMVVAMERWLEGGVQPAARSAFGSPVAQIVGSSYACRNVYNRDQGRLSQHAFGNAFDLPTFVLASGRRVHVVLGWGSRARDQIPKLVPVVAKPEPQTDRVGDDEDQPAQKRTDTAEAKFLRRVHKEACPHFSTVLGPEVDNVHRDHFHLDLQVRGSRDVCR